MIDLTKFERDVLNKLLDGMHPLLTQLRVQLGVCRVKRREFTGTGFYTLLDVDISFSVDNIKLRFGDVIAEINEMAYGAGFVLYVNNGRLSMLEGYGYDEPWPSTVREYTLKYYSGEKRDWNALEKVL